jgi:hypothetical protein
MTSASAFSSRLAADRPALLSGILLILGGALFLAGGAQHPRINSSLGTLGSEQFYAGFAAHAQMAHWGSIHNLILVGPVLWALAAPGMAVVLPRTGAQLWRVACMAFGIGATAWAVAFAMDGFNAPAFSQAIATAADAATLRDKLFEFSISSRLVAYLGRVSWTMMTLAFALFGAGLMLTPRTTTWRKILGAGGIVLGLWTIFELVIGDFTPGPFTSRWWNRTALVTGIWVIAFGVTIAKTRALPATGE